MERLDKVAKFEILKNMSGPDVTRLCSLNKEWVDFCRSSRLYDYLFQRDYPLKYKRNMLLDAKKSVYINLMSKNVVFYMSVSKDGVGPCLYSQPESNSVRIEIPTDFDSVKYLQMVGSKLPRKALNVADVRKGSTFNIYGSYDVDKSGNVSNFDYYLEIPYLPSLFSPSSFYHRVKQTAGVRYNQKALGYHKIVNRGSTIVSEQELLDPENFHEYNDVDEYLYVSPEGRATFYSKVQIC